MIKSGLNFFERGRAIHEETISIQKKVQSGFNPSWSKGQPIKEGLNLELTLVRAVPLTLAAPRVKSRLNLLEILIPASLPGSGQVRFSLRFEIRPGSSVGRGNSACTKEPCPVQHP